MDKIGPAKFEKLRLCSRKGNTSQVSTVKTLARIEKRLNQRGNDIPELGKVCRAWGRPDYEPKGRAEGKNG